MYAELMVAQLRPETTDRACQVYREEMLPPLREKDGYDASFLMTDLDAGKVVIVIVWENEMDVTAERTNGNLQRRISLFEEVLAAPVTTEVFELTSMDSIVNLTFQDRVGTG